jgi:hypothetical protein
LASKRLGIPASGYRVGCPEEAEHFLRKEARVFDSDRSAMSSERYRYEIIAGHMRIKSHHPEVQDALDKGSGQGWRLVSANTTNPGGVYITSIFWDTTPER